MSTPASYRQAVLEDQRLVILQTLARAPDYSLRAPLLTTIVADAGHPVGHDVMQSHLAWLDSRPDPLITLLGDAVPVARLTLRGEDVALGRTHEPGVARPRP